MENQNSKSQGALVRAGEGEGSSCWSHTLPDLGINRGAFVDAGPSEDPACSLSPPHPQVRLLKVSVQGSRGLCLNAGQGLVLVKLSVFLEYVSRENVDFLKCSIRTMYDKEFQSFSCLFLMSIYLSIYGIYFFGKEANSTYQNKRDVTVEKYI